MPGAAQETGASDTPFQYFVWICLAATKCCSEEHSRRKTRQTQTGCLDAKIATDEGEHVDALVIRAYVNSKEPVECRADEAMAENLSEEEIQAEKRTRQNRANRMLDPTEADSRLTATACNRRFEPYCRRHRTADNPGGMVREVALADGAES